jgi:hypothetical protein
MKTNELQELAASITAPMRATGGRDFLEIFPPTLDLCLARAGGGSDGGSRPHHRRTAHRHLRR